MAFVRREHTRLMGALHLYCGDADLAEELAQEALARACRVPRRDAAVSRGVRAHRVAINLANSWFRRRAAERRARARHGAVPTSHDDADAADAVAVRAAVAALPPRARAAVVQRYYADMPVADVAAAMGCAEGTMKALTHKGLTALRTKLAESDQVSDA